MVKVFGLVGIVGSGVVCVLVLEYIEVFCDVFWGGMCCV